MSVTQALTPRYRYQGLRRLVGGVLALYYNPCAVESYDDEGGKGDGACVVM